MSESRQAPRTPVLKFDDLAEPEKIARDAEKLEQDLGLSLLPALGVVGVLTGSLWLLETAAAIKPAAIAILTALGVAAIALLLNRNFRGSQFLLTGGFGVLLMAGLALSGYVGLAVAGMVCLLFLVLVVRGHLDQGSAWLFLPVVPVSLFTLSDTAHGVGVVCSVVFLVLVYAVAYREQRRIAFIALMVAAGVGLYEVRRAEEGRMLLGLCLTAILAAAIGYERKARAEEQSALRQILGHGVVAGLLLMIAVTTIRSSLSLAASTWIWALAVSVYQIVRLALDRGSEPVRAAWIALPTAYAIWMSGSFLPWHIQCTANLLVAGLLHIYAVRVRIQTLSNAAALLVLVVGGRAVDQITRDGADVHGLLISLVTAAGLLLLSQRAPAAGPALPWWRGFILQAHVEKLSYYRGGFDRLVLAPFKRIGMVNAFADAGAHVLRWFRYCRGTKSRPFFDDLLFAAAVALTCLGVSHYAFAWSREHGLAWDASVIIASLVWSAIGLAVVLHGIRNRLLFQRFLGHLCILTPLTYFLQLVLLDRPGMDLSAEKTVQAAMLIQAGVCLAALGVIRRQKQRPRPETSAPLPEHALELENPQNTKAAEEAQPKTPERPSFRF